MKKPLLFINACVRKGSRTRILADRLLQKLAVPYEEIDLNGLVFPKANEDYLQKRDSLDHGDPLFALARQFSQAGTIVIAAPYWDLSFPAVLKQYLEQINVVGITFRYTEAGIPEGLCRADRLIYVTTAGGNGVADEYGYGYVKALAQDYYGIKDVRLIKAEGLDIWGADVDAIMKEALGKIDQKTWL